MAGTRDLVNTAYGYFSQGEPFPVDIEMKLETAGLDPDRLQSLFEVGCDPANVLENEYVDY